MCFAFVAGPAAAGKVNASFFGSVAIEGYDPVAYFEAGEPAQGSDAFEHRWNGVVWRFTNATNRDAFAKAPERYAPQYGGYCAWAVSQGYTASIDPAAWRIVDGKLYLNYSKSVQQTWQQDIPGNIRKANANWPGIEASL
jgi:YHS domain-containing protein